MRRLGPGPLDELPGPGPDERLSVWSQPVVDVEARGRADEPPGPGDADQLGERFATGVPVGDDAARHGGGGDGVGARSPADGQWSRSQNRLKRSCSPVETVRVSPVAVARMSLTVARPTVADMGRADGCPIGPGKRPSRRPVLLPVCLALGWAAG